MFPISKNVLTLENVPVFPPKNPPLFVLATQKVLSFQISPHFACSKCPHTQGLKLKLVLTKIETQQTHTCRGRTRTQPMETHFHEHTHTHTVVRLEHTYTHTNICAHTAAHTHTFSSPLSRIVSREAEGFFSAELFTVEGGRAV